MAKRKTLMLVENSPVPVDIRVWYEATTLRDAGWQVTVISPFVHPEEDGAGGVVREDLEGVEVYRFPLRSAAGGLLGYVTEYVSAFQVMARLSWRAWRDGRFDVIHLSNPPDIFFPLAWFYRLRGARVIFDHHDLFPEQIAARYRGLPARMLYGLARLTEFLSLRSAHAVISTNQSYRQIAVGRNGVRPERDVIVRNGPRLKEFMMADPDPALKQGHPYLVCYAGVMGHEDGVLEVLDVIETCVHGLGRRDILFALLGNGPVYEIAKTRICARGLEAWVTMPGMVPRPTLRRYVATADLCLSPEPATRLNAKSTFIKIGEYMAMGRPVIATDLPESRFTAQEAARYVTPGDAEAMATAILELLDAPTERAAMGQAGRNRMETELAWEHQQARLLEAYQVALAGKKDRSGRKAESPMGEERCQLHDVDGMADGVLPDPARGPLGRVKMVLKRQLSPQRKRAIKTRLNKVRMAAARLNHTEVEPGAEPPGPLGLKAGERVRVRSKAEIMATLDSFHSLRGCTFMTEMLPFCDTTQCVLKPVNVFLDERDYRLKKTRGVVLLENVICEGTETYGPCDRSCFFFWREDWLERIEEEPMA